MHQQEAERVCRYALLLAGARAEHRRALAEGGDPYTTVASSAGGAAVVRRARTLEPTVARQLALLEADGWIWRTSADPHFPAGVTALSDPPLGLLLRGSLPEQPAVAVVGSRRATPYGLQVAGLLSRELAANRVTVVSGMARGIDGAAHRAAIEAGGSTVAVWGTGPDRVYPSEHQRLAKSIAAHGCVVTEYPPGTPPRPGNFPQRNRIVVGLVQAVVVVEAASRSGALITARLAADEGREVLAVPGSILSDVSVGPNALLRMGATPVLGVGDILAELGVALSSESGTGCPAAGEGEPLLTAVPQGEAVAVDQLVETSGLPTATVLARLLDLELDGLLERLDDGRYRRK